jgi:hypothetical protein
MHEQGQDAVFTVEQKVKMIRQKCPGQTGGLRPFKVQVDPATEFLPVPVVLDDIPFLDSPGAHMVECPGKIDPRSSRHTGGSLQ